MNSYHAVAIGIGVVMVAFSLMTLISFFYCIYVMCQANRDQSANEVGNDTMKSGKSTGYCRQTTTTVSVEDNRKTKLPPCQSLVWSTSSNSECCWILSYSSFINLTSGWNKNINSKINSKCDDQFLLIRYLYSIVLIRRIHQRIQQ